MSVNDSCVKNGSHTGLDEGSVFERVKCVIYQSMPAAKGKEMTMESSIIDDVGVDSMDYVELILALESEFGIDIPEEAGEYMVTIGDIVRSIVDIKEGRPVAVFDKKDSDLGSKSEEDESEDPTHS